MAQSSVVGVLSRAPENPDGTDATDLLIKVRWVMKFVTCEFKYRTRAILSRGLYIFYPISKEHFFVFKEVFTENSVLMYGLYSRAACNQERLMMARVRYINFG